jgi:hypothetical protein
MHTSTQLLRSGEMQMSEGATGSTTQAPISAPGPTQTPQPQQAPGSTSMTPPPEQSDDPEYEFEGLGKVKRSEVAKRLARQKELERGAYEKFQKASEMQNQIKQVVGALKSDTRAALKHLGIDPIQFATSVLSEEMERQTMPKEKLEALEAKKELERLKAEKEQYENELKSQRERQEIETWNRRLDSAFTEAISNAGLPRNARTIARMAERVQVYLKSGVPIEQISFHEVASEIHDELMQEKKELLSGYHSTPEKFAEILGEGGIEVVRKYLLSKVKQQPQAAQTTTNPITANRKPRAPKQEASAYIGLNDWIKHKEQRYSK